MHIAVWPGKRSSRKTNTNVISFASVAQAMFLAADQVPSFAGAFVPLYERLPEPSTRPHHVSQRPGRPIYDFAAPTAGRVRHYGQQRPDSDSLFQGFWRKMFGNL